MIKSKYLAQNPRFFSSKSRKAKSKQKANGPKPCASSNPDPSAFLAAPPRKTYPPPQTSPPRHLFPNYTAGTSTPLPPPSMPRKRIAQRLAPMVLPLVLAGYGAYRYLKHSNVLPSEKNKEGKVEVSSAPMGASEQSLLKRQHNKATIHEAFKCATIRNK